MLLRFFHQTCNSCWTACAVLTLHLCLPQHDDYALTDKGTLQEGRCCLFRCGQHCDQRGRHRWIGQVLWSGGCSHRDVCVWMLSCMSVFMHVMRLFQMFTHLVLLLHVRTRKAMGGSMTFKTALTERLSIIRCSREQVNKLITDHPPQLTPGIRWVWIDPVYLSGFILHIIEKDWYASKPATYIKPLVLSNPK